VGGCSLMLESLEVLDVWIERTMQQVDETMLRIWAEVDYH